MIIYLMRHGLIQSNKDKIYAGWSNEELCQEGLPDIIEVGKKLQKYNIEKIYTSPIRRATQTANMVNDLLNRDIIIEENLKEMMMGPWEGLSEDEVSEKFPSEFALWNTKPSKLSIEGRETLEQVQKRAISAIGNISKNSEGSAVLVVTHVALIRVLIIYYNNLSRDIYRKIDIPNVSVYKLNLSIKNKQIKRII